MLALTGAEIIHLRSHRVRCTLYGHYLPQEWRAIWDFLGEQVAVSNQDVQLVSKVVDKKAQAFMTCLDEFGHQSPFRPVPVVCFSL